MTCREFEHRATSLTLWELSQAQGQPILDHASACRKCAGWLQQQRTLAATIRTLQSETAACAAGPDVELALLRAFRLAPSRAIHPEMEDGLTPIAMRLSRFFEVGAYVAVAAAILVGLFLGVHLLEKRSVNSPVQSHVAQPSASLPSVVAESKPLQQPAAVSRSSANRLRTRHVRSASQSSQDMAEPPQTSTDSDYVALMLCDPLSCSSDAQVVRMELPSPGITGSGDTQDAQMRIADVVVGYDGVVRAVRIVN